MPRAQCTKLGGRGTVATPNANVRRMFADGDVVREDVTGEDRERYNARHRAWCREHRHEIKVREVMRKLRGESEA